MGGTLFSSLTIPSYLVQEFKGIGNRYAVGCSEMVVLLVLNYRTSRLCSHILFSKVFSKFPPSKTVSQRPSGGIISDLKNSFLWLFECCYFPAKGTASLFLVDVSISIFPENTIVNSFFLSKICEMFYFHLPWDERFLFKHQKS